MEQWEKLKRLNAISDIGLLFAQNGYDRERYEEIKNLVLDLMSDFRRGDPDALKQLFRQPVDYPTAKVDIRALVFSGDKQQVLMVQEVADGNWSLPGGWGDIGFSPSEVAVKECKEETGLDVVPIRLLAVYDKRKHPHPPEAFYVYKMVILCEAISSGIVKGFDVLDARFFPVDQLPELSEARILKSQIAELVADVKAGIMGVRLD